ncbi:MAG: hypothetical protein FWG32_04480 [Oscillospiraceae bacterium]|nr:hypothetical protein [Oscillospiraceae bacterium]
MNKRMQVTLFSSLTLAVFVICAVLPRLMVSKSDGSDDAPEEALPQSVRIDMFLRHWTGSGPGPADGLVIENLSRDDLSENSALMCAGIRDRLFEGFVIDDIRRDYEINGEQFYAIADDSGGRFILYHVWYQWTGNWNNWFNLCVDADTGVIYCFYISSGVAAGFESRDSVFTRIPEGFILREPVNAEAIARIWPAYCKFECVSVAAAGRFNDDGSPVYTAVYISGDSVINYEISYKYYPASLVDIKFTVGEKD